MVSATVMKALVGAESGGYLLDDVEIPVPEPGMMLCQVHAVALSPYDAKIVNYSNTPGAVGGCDFAGIVVGVGEGVTRFKEGDRVLAVTFGLNASDKTAGAFAEYALATGGLELPYPVQFYLRAGMLIGTCLLRLPFLHMRCRIREYTDNILSVLNCVTDAPTMRMCYEAIGSSGGTYIALEAVTQVVEYTRRDVRADWLMTPTITGTPVVVPGLYGRPSTPEHREFGAKSFLLAEKLLKDGELKNHPLDIRDGGLAKIPTYVNDLRVGNVRGKRMIVPLVDA
ncbi:Polyketide synthase enoylreductase [Penicillium macrosclerotiorum]|uniref:Polyketide synthase enoylreductase n=1 Tax=Penicillium macrosclerotiorum TaxID=303699 RepID=UPI002546D7F1|nr:Polyketide synthase enoylreductase [Penicillium macrosclerotiorum]KAJ5688509.1 Polyketide synthase enoylreductase [Penicillium macrosclerotiorum]